MQKYKKFEYDTLKLLNAKKIRVTNQLILLGRDGRFCYNMKALTEKPRAELGKTAKLRCQKSFHIGNN